MLLLTQTEAYKSLSESSKNVLKGAVKQKLQNNIGIISPEMIELNILELKKYARTAAASPVLMSAISLFEENGRRIQLFNLTDNTSTANAIPASIPFMPGVSGYIAHSDIKQAVPAIFVNMLNIGYWSPDKSSYNDLLSITDLQSCLESGYIAYKLIVENKSNDVFNNALVMQFLTKIYTKLFYDAIVKVPGNIPLLDFQQESAKYIIAKFFLIYILGKTGTDLTVQSIAQEAANGNSTAKSLESYENNLGINYDSLTSFLNTFGMMFFNGTPTRLIDFMYSWTTMYGQETYFAVEYVPYLLHFLFAPLHNSRLGGSSSLYRRLPSLQKEGLSKLYNAVMIAINK